MIGPVGGLAFALDGALWRGGYGALWRGEVRTPVPLEQVHALAFAPDGKTLAVVGGSPGRAGALCLLDPVTGKLRRRIAAHDDLAMAVAWSADTLLTAGHDGRARLWTPLGEPRRTLEGHSGPVLAAALLPGDALCLTAGGDASVRVWEVATGRLLRTLSDHTASVTALAVRPGSGGRAVCASAGRDRSVRLWQPEIGRLLRTVRGFPAGVASLAWSADGAHLFAGGEDGALYTIDGDSDALLATVTLGRDWLVALALAPDGRTLAVGDSAGRVHRRAVGD